MLLSAATLRDVAIDWGSPCGSCMQPWPFVDNKCIESSLLICHLGLSSAFSANASAFQSAVPTNDLQVDVLTRNIDLHFVNFV